MPHEFWKSSAVEARHAPRLDAWFRSRYPLREATMAEQWRGIDRVVTTPGGAVGLDYKCDERAQQSGNVFLEMVSNSVTGRLGWMRTSEAEWLVYYVVPDRVLLCRFARLRPLLAAWAARYPVRAAHNAAYDTLGLCVPVAVVAAAADRVVELGES